MIYDFRDTTKNKVLDLAAKTNDVRLMPTQMNIPYYSSIVTNQKESNSVADLAYNSMNRFEAWQAPVQNPLTGQYTVSKNRNHSALPVQDGHDFIYDLMESHLEEAAIFYGSRLTKLIKFSKELLMYNKEMGSIRPHSDNSTAFNSDKDGNAISYLQNHPERHLVAMYWPNTQVKEDAVHYQHTGGDFCFNAIFKKDALDSDYLKIMPQSGQLVIIPAHSWYLHSVLPVKSGVRFTVLRRFGIY